MSNDRERKLAAILFADIAGYTALMQKDETLASTLLKRFQNELTEKVSNHNGSIVNFYGDGALCTFQNPLEAMRCAIAAQSSFQAEPKVPVRIGIHSGTVVFEGDKVYGDSINLASRIESMGIPGAILVSKKVRDELKNQPDLLMPSLGKFEFKNVDEPMEVFALANEGFAVPKASEMRGKLKGTSATSSTFFRWATVLAIAAITALGLWHVLNKKSNIISGPSDINSIAIFPFDVKGGSEIQYLGVGIVDLLSTKLDGIPEVNPIDPWFWCIKIYPRLYCRTQ